MTVPPNLHDNPNETSQPLVLSVTKAQAAVIRCNRSARAHYESRVLRTQPYGEHHDRPYHLDRDDTQDGFVGQQAGQHEDEFEQDGEAADPSRVRECRCCPDDPMVSDLRGRCGVIWD